MDITASKFTDYLFIVQAENSTSTCQTKEDQLRATVNNQKMNGTVKMTNREA